MQICVFTEVLLHFCLTLDHRRVISVTDLSSFLPFPSPLFPRSLIAPQPALTNSLQATLTRFLRLISTRSESKPYLVRTHFDFYSRIQRSCCGSVTLRYTNRARTIFTETAALATHGKRNGRFDQ